MRDADTTTTGDTVRPAIALFSVAEIRAIEQAALASLPSHTLMQRAGVEAAEAARQLIRADRPARILILAGPGNNGGDALETACNLYQDRLGIGSGVTIKLLLMANPEKQSEDVRLALRRMQTCAIERITPDQLAPAQAQAQDRAHDQDGNEEWDLVIDGLFGIGMGLGTGTPRAMQDDYRRVVAAVNRLRCPVLALDVPSGLNADTGCIIAIATGENNATGGPVDGLAIRATNTITFIGAKPGLYTCEGRDYCGQVQIADLDIERRFFCAPHAVLNAPSHFSHRLQARPQNSHKGSFGDVAIVGGAEGMAGAVILGARAALHAGAGRVYAGFAGQPPVFDMQHPELMCRDAASLDFNRSAVALGPGLGESRNAHDLLARALSARSNLVLDADALNIIAAEPALQQKLATRERLGPTLLTPHPLEAARLLGTDVAAIQANRPQAARTLAQRFQSVVVLKGSGTVIARPDGMIVINPTGNPALATAGSGDVLSGVCAALLAQHWLPWEAALGAVWLHGAAADLLVAQGVGPIGLCASELAPAIRSRLNALISNGPDRPGQTSD